MKKVRALSLIMAALLTLTSLPVAASAATAAVTTTEEVANFPEEASVSYTNGASVTTNTEVRDGEVTNGYITVDSLKWYESKGAWHLGSIELFRIEDADDTFDKGYTYYISFDVRHHSVSTIAGIAKGIDYIGDHPQMIGGKLNGNLNNLNFIKNTATNGNDFLLKDYDDDDRDGVHGWKEKQEGTPDADANGVDNELKEMYEFDTFVGKFVLPDDDDDPTNNKSNDKIQLMLQTHRLRQDSPLDFDNIIIWREKIGDSGSNGELDADDEVTLYLDFNDPNIKYIDHTNPGDAIYHGHPDPNFYDIIYHNFEGEYTNVTKNIDKTENADNSLKITYTNLNGGDGYGAGTYTFSTDIRFSSYHFNDHTTNGYTEYNKHSVNITFTLTDANGNVTTTRPSTADLLPIWGNISSSVTVPVGSTLTGVEITAVPNANYVSLENIDIYNLLNNTIDIKNPTLTLTTEHKDTAGNLNAGILMVLLKKRQSETPRPVNGRLMIGQRAGGEVNYITFDTGVAAEEGRTYYVGFDIRTTDGSNVQIRPIYSGETRESLTGRTPDGKDIGRSEYVDGGFNSTYLVNSSANKLQADWYGVTNADGSEGPKELVMYTVTGKESYFEGYFTPTAAADSIKFLFNRGTSSSQTAPMLLDNLKIWYMDGGKQVVVYEENFDTDSAVTDGKIVGNNGVTVSHYEG